MKDFVNDSLERAPFPKVIRFLIYYIVSCLSLERAPFPKVIRYRLP